MKKLEVSSALDVCLVEKALNEFIESEIEEDWNFSDDFDESKLKRLRRNTAEAHAILLQRSIEADPYTRRTACGPPT
jgi:hypothetical protein